MKRWVSWLLPTREYRMPVLPDAPNKAELDAAAAQHRAARERLAATMRREDDVDETVREIRQNRDALAPAIRRALRGRHP